MKKKYIFIPLICVTLLIATVICVAIALRSSYLEKLPYDHLSDRVYNGVEIVGENGEFYLVKNGQKISSGYASLMSVNDLYGDIDELLTSGKEVFLFDYYIARTKESSDYLLVSSQGDEVLIAGENYSLDTQSTKLPYLVFTNNSNSLKSAVSLYRLDSDISYKSGNELTLRPFKAIRPISTNDGTATCEYLQTDDVSDKAQKSYFRSDGIKITTGENVSAITLFKKDDLRTQFTYLYNATEQTIASVSGELIATGIIEHYRADSTEWQAALCFNPDTSAYYTVVFSPDKSFSLSAAEYDLNTVSFFGNCVLANTASGNATEVIGISGASLGSYASVTPNGSVLTAQSSDGSFCYLNTDGKTVMSGSYGDMYPVDTLFNEKCAVFSSALYNEKNGGSYYHFAKENSSVLTLDVSALEISPINSEYPSFLIKRDGKFSILAPFSSVKESAQFDTVSLNEHNGVVWILAQSYDRGVISIVDPLTAKTVTSITSSNEDFAKYRFTHDDNVALATDPLDSNTAVHISIIKLEKFESEDVLSFTRYYAIYRSAPFADNGLSLSALNVTELGNDLSLEEPYSVHTDKNYLITHSSSGSTVFSLDDTLALSGVASVPYRIDRIISDVNDIDTNYFVVKNDNGMEGLYSTASEAVLAPYYNDIVAIEDRYVAVSIRGAYGVIMPRASGNIKTVIDFLYAYIVPTGDSGYYAVMADGQTDVYEKGRVALSGSVQSFDSIKAYSSDEDGNVSLSYWYSFASNAKLYLHRSAQKAKLTFGTYDACPPPLDNASLNERSTVIYYYSNNKVIHTQVLHPTEEITDMLSLLYCSAEGQLWYTSESAQAPVTAEYLSERNIIKLYALN